MSNGFVNRRFGVRPPEVASTSPDKDLHSNCSLFDSANIAPPNAASDAVPAPRSVGTAVGRWAGYIKPTIEPRACGTCGVTFTPAKIKTTGANRNSYCSRRCAARAPRPKVNFHTPESTKAERVRANGLVNSRIRCYGLIRPTACQWCAKLGRTDGHHPDYQKPDLVAFLCRSCHGKCHHDRAFEARVAVIARPVFDLPAKPRVPQPPPTEKELRERAERARRPGAGAANRIACAIRRGATFSLLPAARQPAGTEGQVPRG